MDLATRRKHDPDKVEDAASHLRWEHVLMRQVVTVPSNQSRIAGVLKEEFQRRRFDMSVAKNYVDFVLVAE